MDPKAIPPVERLLMNFATGVDKRVEHFIGVVAVQCPDLDPIVVSRRAVVMALLERDHRLMSRLEECVRIAEVVALVPDLEVAATRNMGELLKLAGLADASYARDPRRDSFYGPTLLFGFTVRLNGSEAEVGLPADVSACRSYVGGNSWMWEDAPRILRAALETGATT